MASEKKQSNAGKRPSEGLSLYDASVCPAVIEQCKAGATDVEIADFLAIHIRTFYRWRSTHAEFREALTTGKADPDNRVSRSLYHRACGYEWDEDEAVKLKDVSYENGKRVQEIERVEIATVRRSLPPDIRAATFWLKNRRPDLWRDKQDHELTGKDGLPLEAVEPRELAKAVKAMLAAAELEHTDE